MTGIQGEKAHEVSFGVMSDKMVCDPVQDVTSGVRDRRTGRERRDVREVERFPPAMLSPPPDESSPGSGASQAHHRLILRSRRRPARRVDRLRPETQSVTASFGC